MPLRIEEGSANPAGAFQQVFGIPSPPPPPPVAQPTLGGAPILSATPNPGQGIATDASGRLPVGVAAQSVLVTTADPASPAIGQVWYRSDTSQLCIRHSAATTKRVTLA